MPTAKKTISQTFQEFLSDQEARLSPRTLSKYKDILSFLELIWSPTGPVTIRPNIAVSPAKAAPSAALLGPRRFRVGIRSFWVTSCPTRSCAARTP